MWKSIYARVEINFFWIKPNERKIYAISTNCCGYKNIELGIPYFYVILIFNLDKII